VQLLADWSDPAGRDHGGCVELHYDRRTDEAIVGAQVVAMVQVGGANGSSFASAALICAWGSSDPARSGRFHGTSAPAGG
jgi:hypothetical protein